MNIHGNADTHIDALCHVIYDGAISTWQPASDRVCACSQRPSSCARTQRGSSR